MKIYDVIQGPFKASDFEGYPSDASFYIVVCKIEDATGALLEEDVAFPSFYHAMSVVDHFKQQIVPYEITQ